jgi:hypothetical protein
MPLEIRELVIRTTFTDQSSAISDVLRREYDDDRQALIIAACVDQVLAILQARSER